MARIENAHRPVYFRYFFLFAILMFSATAVVAAAQGLSESPLYAQRNTLGIFGAYSPNSSRILLGNAENRELVNIGVAYNRRPLLNHLVNWQYSGEIAPVALESDPRTRIVNNQTAPTNDSYVADLPSSMVVCSPVVVPYTVTFNGVTYSGTETYSCSGRQWTMGEAMSPVGMQWNFLPLRKTQPFVNGHGGYMYSTQPIPITNAGSFNFTFDIGAGFEIFRSKTRSIRAEYRYHHISNHGTAYMNPGIDNGLMQVTYCFHLGR